MEVALQILSQLMEEFLLVRENIERNNGKDFDIKNVFNDCQVSMFND